MPLLFLLFVLVGFAELWVLIEVGGVIGAPATLLAVVVISLLGAALVRREGFKAWVRFRRAVDEGRLPGNEVVDGALLLLAGALLVTPGFLTDGVGLLLAFAPTRSGLRRLLARRLRATTGMSQPGVGRQTGSSGEAIDVEVVRVERDERPAPGEVTGGDDERD